MNCLANQEPHSEERFSCFSVNKMYWEEHKHEWKMLLNNNHTQKVAANGTKHKRHFVARGPTNYNQKKKSHLLENTTVIEWQIWNQRQSGYPSTYFWEEWSSYNTNKVKVI